MLEIIYFKEEDIKNFIEIENCISSDSVDQIPEDNSKIEIIEDEINTKNINTNESTKINKNKLNLLKIYYTLHS